MSLVQAITAPSHITAALQQASAKTGTDFNYLLKTAMRESSLDCNAKSSTSSACGLFQFTEQSWLGTMKQDGGALGLGQYADQISRDSRGRYVVTDPAARREILALRNDPEVSALMAGAYTNDSRERLEGRLGRDVNGGELYIAHFLGAGGASKMISSAEETPNAPADELFPAAAAANRSIFYNRDGSPRSVNEVYDNLVAKHRNTANSAVSTQTTQWHPTNKGVSVARPMTQAALSQAMNFQNFSAAISGSDKAGAAADHHGALSAYGSSYTETRSTGLPASGIGQLSPLSLSAGVVEVLASLDVPDMAKGDELRAPSKGERDMRDEQAERAQSRREARLILPSRGHALG